MEREIPGVRTMAGGHALGREKQRTSMGKYNYNSPHGFQFQTINSACVTWPLMLCHVSRQKENSKYLECLGGAGVKLPSGSRISPVQCTCIITMPFSGLIKNDLQGIGYNIFQARIVSEIALRVQLF